MDQQHTINDKPLNECSLKELVGAWELGMYLDSTVGLTKEEDERHSAIERELFSRPDPKEDV